MNIPINDNDEIKYAISALKIHMFQGIANTCPNCKKEGHYGSIVSLHCESGNNYLLCGWCGTVTLKVKERGEQNERK